MLSKHIIIPFIMFMGVMAVLKVWDYLSGESETWVDYERKDGIKVLSEYNAYDECTESIKTHDEPSGCRRTDGPYGILNFLTDLKDGAN